MKKPISPPRHPARMAQRKVKQHQPAWRQQLEQKLFCCWRGDNKTVEDDIAMSRVHSTRTAPARPRRPSESGLGPSLRPQLEQPRIRSRPEQQTGLDRTEPFPSPVFESPTARLVPKDQDGEALSTNHDTNEAVDHGMTLRSQQLRGEAGTIRRRLDPEWLDSKSDDGKVDQPTRASTPVPTTTLRKMAASGDLKTLPSMRRRLEAQSQASPVHAGGVDVEKKAGPVPRGNV